MAEPSPLSGSSVSNHNRVVITGLGVLAANGHGVEEFTTALRECRSGITYHARLAELKFACRIGGLPKNVDELKHQYLSEEKLFAMNSFMVYSAIAAMDAWRDAALPEPDPGGDPDWDTGAIIGSSAGGADTMVERVGPLIDAGKVKRLGSSTPEQIMMNGGAASVAGLLGLGNAVMANASACNTGGEAIIWAYHHIREGRAKRMLAGGSEGDSYHVWGTFDAMRVLCRAYNDEPEKASRPMSATAKGFVPSCGSGILLLESLDSALERGARIYGEIIGAYANCGGMRNGGTMSAPNSTGVQRCITGAVAQAGIDPEEIDVINGHLTATFADPIEVRNWSEALGLPLENLPLLQSTKSLIGHGLSASGSIECVAALIQLYQGFVHGSINCEDVHPELAACADRIPHRTIDALDFDIITKASFGFGDVNGCLIFKKYVV